MKPIFGGFVCAAGDGKVGNCALITPVYLEIALMSGARSGARATGQAISAIDIADISIRAHVLSGHVPEISIHALREEGDNEHSGLQHHPHHFYPRPPRGGRQGRTSSRDIWEEFLSTPSARRATAS